MIRACKVVSDANAGHSCRLGRRPVLPPHQLVVSHGLEGLHSLVHGPHPATQFAGAVHVLRGHVLREALLRKITARRSRNIEVAAAATAAAKMRVENRHERHEFQYDARFYTDNTIDKKGPKATSAIFSYRQGLRLIFRTSRGTVR